MFELRTPITSRRPRWLRRAVAAALVAASLLAWKQPCFAASDTQIPPGCGTAEEFEREVRQRLGRESVLPPTSLEIVPEGAAYRLRMSVGGEQRELEDADCRQLFRAAVVVAVAVTLSQSAEHPPREEKRAPASNPPPPRQSEPASPSNLELALGLGGGFNLGLLPGVALALELQAKSVFYDRVGVVLAGRYLAPRSESDSENRGLTVRAIGGQFAGVYRPIGYLEAALGASAYRLFGTGSGLGKRSDTAWAGGPNAGLSFLPLQQGPLWVGLAGELQWNIVRPTFEFLNYGPIFTSSRFDFSLFLRVGPRFH